MNLSTLSFVSAVETIKRKGASEEDLNKIYKIFYHYYTNDDDSPKTYQMRAGTLAKIFMKYGFCRNEIAEILGLSDSMVRKGEEQL